MIKAFFITLCIVGGLAATAYFVYEPYIKPLLAGDEIDLSGDSVAPEKGKPEIAPKKAKSAVKPSTSVAAPAKKKTAPKSEIDQLLEKKYPMPDILPLEQIVQNWKMVPPNAYPAEVAVNEMLAFDLIVNGKKIGASKVPPGSLLKPVRLVGDQLTVANIANPTMSKQVQVDKTDFKQRISKRYNDFVTLKTNQTMSRRSKARKILEAKKGLVAMLKSVVKFDDSGDPRFSPVKASIRAGECPTVKMEEAQSFKWNGSETIGGSNPGTYDTATVHFKVKTIFGEFPIDCKCLLKGGRVVAWIDPITEEKI